MDSTWPNPTQVGWVEFFWPILVGWVKKPSQPDLIQPMHTPNGMLRMYVQ